MKLLLILLLTSIATAAFWGFDWLFMSRHTHYGWRRCYFLCAILLSLLLPLASLLPYEFNVLSYLGSVFSQDELPRRVFLAEIWVQLEQLSGDESARTAGYLLPKFLLGAWLLAVVALGLRFLVQVFSLRRFLSSASPSRCLGYRVYVLPEAKEPFSFCQRIYLSPDDLCNPHLSFILKHEAEHVRGKHFVDLLLVELFCILQCYNPFAWLLRQGLKGNLEMLADRAVLQSGANRKVYQYELLRLATRGAGQEFVTRYNSNHLKQRIEMMNRKMSKTRILAAYLGVLPMSLGLFAIANGLQASEQDRGIQIEATSPEFAETVLIEDSPKQEEDPIYKVVDKFPEYPGGQAALMSFLAKNMTYPAEAATKGIQGRVFVRFVVEKDGSVSNPTIQRGVDKLLDDEALRVVKLLEKFEPAQHNGKAVRVEFVLPLVFKLP